MSNGDRTLFGMHTERAQRRSGKRGQRQAARPGGGTKAETAAPGSSPAEAATPAEAESVSEILRAAREQEAALRSRLEARIAELEADLREARATAAAPAAKTDLGFLDLQATLAAQQVEQQHREALDLWLVEAELRADDEDRRKTLAEAPALIPTLVDPPVAAAARSETAAPASAAGSADLREKLDSATVAMEAAEARAAHNATQVKRLTEELMAARQEQMRTAGRLRDLEDRLRKAETRTGAAEPDQEAPAPEAIKPDHSMTLPLEEATGTPVEALDEAPAMADAAPGLEELSLETTAPAEELAGGTAIDDATLEVDDIRGEGLIEELDPFGGGMDETAIAETPAEDEVFGLEDTVNLTLPETEAAPEDPGLTLDADAPESVLEIPEPKSPIDALADVLSEWDEKPAARSGMQDIGLEDEAASLDELTPPEPAAEPDIAEALASWSRGELIKDPLPELDDFITEIPREEIESIEAAAETPPEEAVSLEDALADWGTEPVARAEGHDAAAAPTGIETGIAEVEAETVAEVGDDAPALDAGVELPPELPEPAADAQGAAGVFPEDDEDDETIFGDAEPIITELDPDDDEAGFAFPETPADAELMDGEPDAADDFIPEAPAPAAEAPPIAARARDNASRMNENLQQWSGLKDTTPRKPAETPEPVAAPSDAEAPEHAGDGKRDQGKKAMVDALLKFMGQR